MVIQLPPRVNRIIEILESQGHEAFAVGGCVRDSLMGLCPKDWDITTSARPEAVKALFRHTIDTGIAHGTVTVMMGGAGYEVTTYRIDGKYEDSRHPREVTFTPNLEEDLQRRDFTINAMACHPVRGLVDRFGGLADIRRKCIRCVGDPKARFGEDALRMLRAVRFSAQLGFSIEENTGAAIRELAPNLARISAERIQAELLKLLLSDRPWELEAAYSLGVTKIIFPEFDSMMETPQNNPHHAYSVGHHTLQSLSQVPAEKSLRLAMLLHDVAKPACRTTDEKGVDHFYGHPRKGADLAVCILKRLKLDNKTIQTVSRLVSWHDYRPGATRKGIRKALHTIGADLFPLWLQVKRADILAQSGFQREEKLQALRQYEDCYREILEKQECISLRDLALKGADLIDLGVKPGKQIGEILNRLLDLVLECPECNDREKLIQYMKEQHVL